jgi:hypothetical protein
MPLSDAHAAVTQLFDEGEAIVDVPVVEDVGALVRELAECNAVATALQAEPASVQPK